MARKSKTRSARDGSTSESLSDPFCESSLSANAQEQLAAILDQYLQAVEQGLPVDVEKLVGAHPDLAEPLREYLEGLELLHGVQPLGILSDSKPARSVTPSQAIFPSTADETGFETKDTSVRRLGDYEIIREIGRGGMGVVYEAEQISLRRRVALKVLPFAALLDDRQIQRFENEARAAARLHHPNIVPVHGVGSERGVHFYAMQFIDGSSLRDVIEAVREQDRPDSIKSSHCDETRALYNDSTANHAVPAKTPCSSSGISNTTAADVKTIAKLGRNVAEALHAAHECGVIHRDIKPSNLLLDGHGKVWITDFGLARCQSNGTMTHSGDVMGTLQYMSPEQALGQNALIDPRSDVYSLGVTLYELLTLQRPFEGEGHASVVRQIELGQHESLRSVSPDVPRDLANIVEKAMAASREDRYASAQELADDLRRYLDGQAIHAKPPNLFQRTMKWAGRHRAAVLGTVALLWLASVCLTVTAVHIARGKAKTDERLETNRQTIEEFGLRAAEYLKGIAGTEAVRRDLLTEVLESHEKLLEQVGDTPALRADLALTLSKIATIHWDLGELDLALEKFREAEGALSEMVQETPAVLSSNSENLQHRAALARCRSQIGMLLREQGERTQSMQTIQQAIATQEELRKLSPNNIEFDLDIAKSWCDLGVLCADDAQTEVAQRYFQQAHKLLSELETRHSTDRQVVDALARVLGNLAGLYAKTDPASAIAWSEKSLEQRRVAKEMDPADTQAKRLYASEYAELANLYAKVRRSDDDYEKKALNAFRQVIKLQEGLIQSDGGFASHRKDLAITLNNFGRLLHDTHDAKPSHRLESLHAFQRALNLQRDLCDEFPSDLSLLCRFGGIHNNLAMCMRDRNSRRAEEHFHKGLICLHKVFRLAPEVPTHREYYDRNLENLATWFRDQGKPTRAAQVAYRRCGLYPNNPTQLGDVAKTLMLAIREMPRGLERRKWERRAARTVDEAIQVGWQPKSAEREVLSMVLGRALSREVTWPETAKHVGHAEGRS